MVRKKGDGSKKWEKAELRKPSTESELQSLLTRDPDLIPFDDIQEPVGEHRVAIRQLPLPNAGQLDLMIVDENGTMAMVEAKLARSPDARRKVLAQVVDYASDLWGMSYEELDELVSRTGEGKRLCDILRDKLGEAQWDETAFKESVANRLKEGSLILLIAVDSVSEDLERIVEYLNRSPGIRVYPLEVRYYESQGYEAVAPRVVSMGVQPPPPPRLPWDWERFAMMANAEDVDVLRELRDFAQENNCIRWGMGKKVPTFGFYVNVEGKESLLFGVEAAGVVYVGIKQFRERIGADRFERIIKQLRELPSLSQIDSDIPWKTFKVKELREADRMMTFKNAVLAMKQALESPA